MMSLLQLYHLLFFVKSEPAISLDDTKMEWKNDIDGRLEDKSFD